MRIHETKQTLLTSLTECEDDIKDRSAKKVGGDQPVDPRLPSMGAKSLCIPFEQPAGEHAILEGKTMCVACGKPAKVTRDARLAFERSSHFVELDTVRTIILVTRPLAITFELLSLQFVTSQKGVVVS